MEHICAIEVLLTCSQLESENAFSVLGETSAQQWLHASPRFMRNKIAETVFVYIFAILASFSLALFAAYSLPCV